MSVTETKNDKLGVLFALINTVGLGIVSIVDKIGTTKTISPFIFSVQSIFFAFIFTLLFSAFFLRGQFLEKVKTTSLPSWKLIFVVGVFSSGLFILFRFLGISQTTGTFASLSQVVTTSFTALMAHFFLKERLSKQFWLLFFVLIVSTYFFSIGKFSVASMKAGDLLILCGTVFLATGNIFSKVAVRKTSPITLSVGRFFFGFVFLLFSGIIVLGPSAAFYHPSIFAVFSGLIWSIMILAFNSAIQKIGIAFATSLLMSAPVITLILESTLLHKSFTPVQVIGAIVMILCGVLIVRLNNTKNHSSIGAQLLRDA